MLIQVTRKCNEGCSHCMIDASPTGAHMTQQVFTNALKFAIDNQVGVIIITGGEPFLHPDIFKFINQAIKAIENKKLIIILESNGYWIEDKDMCEKISKVMKNPQIAGMQVSTHEKYYPNYERTISHILDFKKISSKIEVVADWQGVKTHLKYLGRAKNIMSEDDVEGVPGCLNLWQHVIQSLSWSQAIIRNVTNYHTCSPAIQVNGDITLGEASACKSVGNLEFYSKDRSKQWFINAQKFIPCDRCKCVKNLSQHQKMTLDMLRINKGLQPIYHERTSN